MEHIDQIKQSLYSATRLTPCPDMNGSLTRELQLTSATTDPCLKVSQFAHPPSEAVTVQPLSQLTDTAQSTSHSLLRLASTQQRLCQTFSMLLIAGATSSLCLLLQTKLASLSEATEISCFLLTTKAGISHSLHASTDCSASVYTGQRQTCPQSQASLM